MPHTYLVINATTQGFEDFVQMLQQKVGVTKVVCFAGIDPPNSVRITVTDAQCSHLVSTNIIRVLEENPRAIQDDADWYMV